MKKLLSKEIEEKFRITTDAMPEVSYMEFKVAGCQYGFGGSEHPCLRDTQVKSGLESTPEQSR